MLWWLLSIQTWPTKEVLPNNNAARPKWWSVSSLSRNLYHTEWHHCALRPVSEHHNHPWSWRQTSTVLFDSHCCFVHAQNCFWISAISLSVQKYHTKTFLFTLCTNLPLRFLITLIKGEYHVLFVCSYMQTLVFPPWNKLLLDFLSPLLPGYSLV